jgi:hypothetical protein
MPQGEKTARDLAGLQRGELRGRGRLGELDANARALPVKLPQDARLHGGHRESRERDAHMPHLSAGECLKFAGNGLHLAEQGLQPFTQQPAGVISTPQRVRLSKSASSAVSSCAIARLRAGWAMASFSAALRKCSCRATSRK